MIIDLRSLTPTLCNLMKIDPPGVSTAPVIDEVIEYARQVVTNHGFQRCLVFNPDALGKQLYEHHRKRFEVVESIAPLKVGLRSMFPPKTPVCFASMYTGSAPDVHGILQYEKPVLKVDTLFDTLSGSGIRTAIVAVKDSSIDLIFRNREIDYFTEVDDTEVTRRVVSLMEMGEHEFIVAYQQEYDDTLYLTLPESPPALEAMVNHIQGFSILGEAFDKYWRDYNRVIVFAPDHGGHVDDVTGRGNHGLDIPADMDLVHFWGFRAGKQQP